MTKIKAIMIGCLAAVGVLAISACEMVALSKGIDGIALGAVAASIGAIIGSAGGYIAGKAPRTGAPLPGLLIAGALLAGSAGGCAHTKVTAKPECLMDAAAKCVNALAGCVEVNSKDVPPPLPVEEK